MKRIAFTFGLLATTAVAAPLSAQSGNGPWWDPANTGNRSTVDSRNGSVYDRDGRVYDRNGSVYGNTRADGQWRRQGRDRNGNYIYARTRYDSNGRLVQERALRDRLGRYRVIDRRVIRNANDRRRDNDRNNDGWEDRRGNDKNDRWEQNGGHDNGKHNGQYKNKNKNKGKGRNR